MTAEQWGPTGTARAINKHNLRVHEQRAYTFNVDRLLCCGCVLHSGAETSDCECGCHWAARLAARKEFVEVKS